MGGHHSALNNGWNCQRGLLFPTSSSTFCPHLDPPALKSCPQKLRDLRLSREGQREGDEPERSQVPTNIYSKSSRCSLTVEPTQNACNMIALVVQGLVLHAHPESPGGGRGSSTLNLSEGPVVTVLACSSSLLHGFVRSPLSFFTSPLSLPANSPASGLVSQRIWGTQTYARSKPDVNSITCL